MSYAVNRKTVRKNFAALLNIELVTTRAIVQAVYDNQVGDFGGQSPVMVVSSGGTSGQRKTLAGSMRTYWLNVHVFVLYATQDGTWTEANAEDTLDDINEALFDVVEANQTTANWEVLELDSPSLPSSVVIGGEEYRMEQIRIRVM